MDAETAQRLLDINRQFYQTFALQFSATRQRLQPGVLHIIERYLKGAPEGTRVLDLGCGNGELARQLGQLGFRGTYTGLDFSPGLLEEARRGQAHEMDVRFLQADLAHPSWLGGETGQELKAQAPFHIILAFAVLHHLPGRELRLNTLQAARDLIALGGWFIHSEWQFLNSSRLRGRIQPWQSAGLQPESIEPGDYLLDWRSGGSGLRYAHHFSVEELEELSAAAGFRVAETFLSDGEGGQLGLYQVWQAA